MATKYMNASELAERWSMTTQGIVNAILSGKIPAFQLGPRGHYRISMEWIERYERTSSAETGNVESMPEVPESAN